jgi:hypothetical protein
MKELIIPATLILTIFGLPILTMLAEIVSACIEKPRWRLATVAEKPAMHC